MVTQVEALEARRVIEFALEMGTTQATFEGDSDIIFKDLTKSLPSLALYGHLIHDLKLLDSLFF